MAMQMLRILGTIAAVGFIAYHSTQFSDLVTGAGGVYNKTFKGLSAPVLSPVSVR